LFRLVWANGDKYKPLDLARLLSEVLQALTNLAVAGNTRVRRLQSGSLSTYGNAARELV
jgi:hypothetical protein